MNTVTRTFLFTLIFALISLPAYAASLRDGYVAYEKGDYATAINIWRPLAEKGHPMAQFALGFMYYFGQGVPQDYKEAVKWFRLAAEQGNATAQFNLGVMYAKGEGVPQNYKEAVKWSRLAAEKGNADAQSFLGGMYFYGVGVVQDYVKAHKWANLAAANGHEAARMLRDDIAKEMTPEQISMAQALAREFVQK